MMGRRARGPAGLGFGPRSPGHDDAGRSHRLAGPDSCEHLLTIGCRRAGARTLARMWSAGGLAGPVSARRSLYLERELWEDSSGWERAWLVGLC